MNSSGQDLSFVSSVRLALKPSSGIVHRRLRSPQIRLKAEAYHSI